MKAVFFILLLALCYVEGLDSFNNDGAANPDWWKGRWPHPHPWIPPHPFPSIPPSLAKCYSEVWTMRKACVPQVIRSRMTGKISFNGDCCNAVKSVSDDCKPHFPTPILDFIKAQCISSPSPQPHPPSKPPTPAPDAPSNSPTPAPELTPADQPCPPPDSSSESPEPSSESPEPSDSPSPAPAPVYY